MDRALLLVDDEANILKSLARTLRPVGYRIHTADGGEAALAVLADREIGVIVSDQRMPGMTGVEFLSRAKALYPHTVRIMLSGYTELRSVTDAINEGAIYKFLTKPWDDELLRANIDEAFQYHELRQENERLTRELTVANRELSDINRELERRVEHKTREVMLSVHTLRVAQEVLEELPAGVVGIDDAGTIAVANRMARELFDDSGCGLVGRSARDVLPAALRLSSDGPPGSGLGSRLEGPAGVLQVQMSRLGHHSEGRGTVLICMPAPTA